MNDPHGLEQVGHYVDRMLHDLRVGGEIESEGVRALRTIQEDLDRLNRKLLEQDEAEAIESIQKTARKRG